MYLAVIVGAGTISWQTGRLMAKQQDPQPVAATPVIAETPSSFQIAEVRPASVISNPAIARYYFEHVSEFAPLPHSPRERAKALQQIEATIQQKLGASRQS
jgi:hypothetical protein